MRDKEGAVIYVGKAKALKNRVTSYFRSVEKHLPKVYKMVEHVEDFSYIVTDSEFEALVLECSLIKKYNPKYNILLKDDKGYHYIQISPKRWSRITAAHNNKEEDAVYIGPFTSSFVVKQTVEEANQIFMLPTCNRRFPAERGKGRPCLNYYIKQCIGVCRGKITEEEYQEQVQQAVDFIKGGGASAIQRLTQLMEEAAENLDFEKAASLRDRIQAIQKLNEHQKVIYARVPEQDVIAIAKSDGTACAAILKFRAERLVDKEDYLFPDVESVSDAMTHFISRYYSAGRETPRQISLHDESEEIELLEQYLAKQAGRKVTVTVPKRGDQRKLAEMAYNNAAQRLSMESRRTTGREVAALDELARLLGLDKTPSYIEAYDISNIGSGTVVGGMVVFEDAKPKRSNYRRYSFERSAPDDYGCMREMLTRRFTRYLEEKDKEPLTAFGRLPDLILLDGGKGHVAVVQEVLEQLGISVPVFGKKQT